MFKEEDFENLDEYTKKYLEKISDIELNIIRYLRIDVPQTYSLHNLEYVIFIFLSDGSLIIEKILKSNDSSNGFSIGNIARAISVDLFLKSPKYFLQGTDESLIKIIVDKFKKAFFDDKKYNAEILTHSLNYGPFELSCFAGQYIYKTTGDIKPLMRAIRKYARREIKVFKSAKSKKGDAWRITDRVLDYYKKDKNFMVYSNFFYIIDKEFFMYMYEKRQGNVV